MNFKQFFLQSEMNVPGYHLDGNTGSGGGYVDSQQSGSETKGQDANTDQNGLSLYSTDLGMPTKIDRNQIISGVDKKNLSIFFKGGGGMKLQNNDMWRHYVKGKEPEVGDRADVEYWTNQNDNTSGEKKIVAIRVY